MDVDEYADWEAMTHKQGMAGAVKGLQDLKADIIIHISPPNQYYRDTYWAAKKAQIPIRIGTLRKATSLLTCNRFVNIVRNQSGLHETQLDMFFLKALSIKSDYSLKDIIELRRYKHLPPNDPCLKWLDKKNLI